MDRLTGTLISPVGFTVVNDGNGKRRCILKVASWE